MGSNKKDCVPIDWNARERTEQEDGQSAEESAHNKTKFDRSPPIAQEAPDGTGNAIKAILEAKEDADVQVRQAELLRRKTGNY